MEKRTVIFVARLVPKGLVFIVVWCLWSTGQAQTNYQRLWAFNQASGYPPSGPLIEGSDGRLYGTTSYGGDTNSAGTVFRLNKDGTGYTVLHYFVDSGPGGAQPQAVVQGADGALYGTTAYGGLPTGPPGFGPGLGTVFKLNSDGSSFQVLHSFSTNVDDGAYPAGQLVVDGAMVYGTTSEGGAKGNGTLFELLTDGSGFAIVRSFAGGVDLAGPQGGLLKATNGAFYGMTTYGSSNNFAGAIFKINPDGTGFAIVHQFNETNGDASCACLGLIQARDGRIYGVTDSGGTDGRGALFHVNPDGSSYQVLRSFSLDEIHPQPVIEGADGQLYGATYSGGSFRAGAAFKLDKSGTGYTLLHSFSGSGGDGNGPVTALMQASDGSFFGTTYYGGFTDINSPLGYGTIFRLFSGVPQIRITDLQFSSGGARLNLSGGVAGQRYNLQARTNLQSADSWVGIGTATAAIDGSFQFLDSNASQYPARFYRTAGQ